MGFRIVGNIHNVVNEELVNSVLKRIEKTTKQINDARHKSQAELDADELRAANPEDWDAVQREISAKEAMAKYKAAKKTFK